jgi:hypothetical protein
MAGQGAKKRVEDNKRHVQKLRTVALVGLLLYIFGRFGWYKSSVTWLNYVGLVMLASIEYMSYRWIALAAAPKYDAEGKLEDGGMDLFSGGTVSYAHDVLYVCIFLGIVGIFTDWVWLIWLVVALFILYQLWVKILYPYVFSSRPQEAQDGGNAGPMSRKEKRQQERADAKSGRKVAGKR